MAAAGIVWYSGTDSREARQSRVREKMVAVARQVRLSIVLYVWFGKNALPVAGAPRGARFPIV